MVLDRDIYLVFTALQSIVLGTYAVSTPSSALSSTACTEAW
jgi:hypothetical protein